VAILRRLLAFVSPRGTFFWHVLIAGALALRFWGVIIFYRPSQLIYSDMHRHWDNAQNFLKPGPMGSANPWFYQWWLYTTRKLTNDAEYPMAFINLALSYLTMLFWYLLAREVVKDRRVALAYIAVMGLLPTHVFVFMYYMSETLLLPLVGAGLWLAARAAKKRSPVRFLTSIAVWTMAVLTKSVAVPAAVFASAYALWFQRKRWWPLLVAGAVGIMAIGFVPAAKHAYVHLHRYTVFGDGTNVAIYFASGARDYQVTWGPKRGRRYTYVFSSPSYYISPFHPYKWRTKRQGIVKFTLDPNEEGRDVRARFQQELVANKHKLPRLIFENFIFLSFGHNWPMAGLDNDLGKICLKERVIWFPLILTSTIGAVITLWRRIRPLPAITLLLTLALYSAHMTVMEGRYRKVIEPIVLLNVFWCFERLVTWWRERRARAVV